MAAYAALYSLNFTIEQHRRRSVVYPTQYPVQSVQETICSLLKIFEDHDYETSKEQVEELEREIAESAYDVDYVIECLALDPVLLKSGYKGKHSSNLFSEEEILHIMERFDSVREIVIMEVDNQQESLAPSSTGSASVPDPLPRNKEKRKSEKVVNRILYKLMKKLESLGKKPMKVMDDKVTSDQDQLPGSLIPSGPSRNDNPAGIVGFDDDKARVIFQIRRASSALEILPIVGMGGIGKTTFTRYVFDSDLMKEDFEIRIWCTISQSPDLESVLSSFLQDLGIVEDGQTNPGEQLHKRLAGKRYLIVLDDIWGVDVWDTIRSFFPDTYGSRIIITTRLLNVASYIGTLEPYELPLLNEEASWDLLMQKVFAGDVCPPELDHIGMQIARGCRGLPLVIVVIAGHLSNNMRRNSWESVEMLLRSVVDSEGEDWCLKILSFCYEKLPVYIKPCFLYMGVFPEDHSIQVSLLIKMWIAEGFLRPKGDQCLEAVAMEYLKDLIQRNLFLVTELSSTGKIKYLQIHDFVRDLCLKKAHEYNFLHTSTYFSLGVLPGAERDYPLYILPARERYIEVSSSELASNFCGNKNLMHFRLRCIRLSAARVMDISICSAYLASVYMFKNLHTLIMRHIPGHEPVILPLQIWEMPLLKHVEIQRVVLPNPLDAESHVNEELHYVLKDMQTLLNVYNFNFSDEVLEIISNLKKLKITYTEVSESGERPWCCLDNIVQLRKLDSLSCCVLGMISTAHISFPQSLRSLRLDGGMIPWKDISKVGSLPNLEKLSLWNDAFWGSEWRMIEGQFCKLKVLHLRCLSLEHWEACRNHFPVLERLTFYNIQRLKEIPRDIGEIRTLQLVSIEGCCTSLIVSALSLKRQKRYSELQVHVS